MILQVAEPADPAVGLLGGVGLGLGHFSGVMSYILSFKGSNNEIGRGKLSETD